MNLLLVEDNPVFGRVLRDRLSLAGYVVDWVRTIASFHDVTAVVSHDVYLIDLGMPDGDGLELIKAVREKKQSVPILIVSARDSAEHFVEGLDCGADDYIAKPFNVDVLLSRIRALLRRPPVVQAEFIEVGRLALDNATGEVQCNKKSLNLSPSEQRLLALLIKRQGRIVTKDSIDSSVHGLNCPTTDNATEKLVSRLRRAISREEMGINLRTVRGSGYVLEEAGIAS